MASSGAVGPATASAVPSVARPGPGLPAWARVGAWIALLGPGLLAMAGDNDAGGLLTYASTGARFGAGTFVAMLVPLGLCAYAVQDMALRVGAVTRRGLASLVRNRYSRAWAYLAGCDLALQNWLTLVTEFAGMGVALRHFGVPLPLGVALSCALVLGLVLAYPYRVAERLAVGLGVASMLFVPLAIHAAVHHGAAPIWAGRSGPDLRLFLVAAAGNALAPWMMFFQAQASAERGGAETIPDGRLDLAAGSVVQVAVAAAVIVLGAAGLSATAGNPGVSGGLFAVGLFDAGLVAALTVSLSTAWAVTETFGGEPRPGARASEAPGFYSAYAAGLVLAAGAVLLPGLSPELVAVVVQAASAVLLPPVLALLVALCNDPAVMPVHRNTLWWNVAAAVILALFVAACAWLLTGGAR